MHKSIHPAQTCTSTIKLLGDYWTLRIIDALKTEEMRFCELQRNLDNVNPVTLTSRLKLLENAGIITRIEESIDKISVSYSLTQLGKKALPVIKELSNFATHTQD